MDAPDVRGTPFIQAILMVAVFLLAGVPVYRLTRPAALASAASESTADKTPDSATAKASSLEVEVVCASAPEDFQIKCLDQTVLAGHGPQARFSRRWTTALPPEGADLVVQAHWPAAGENPAGANPAAARVTVRFADGRQVEKSVWADANGTVNEVFTVSGETPP